MVKNTLLNKPNSIVELYKSDKWRDKLLNMFKILNTVNINNNDILNILNKSNSKTTNAKIFGDILKLNYESKKMYDEKSDFKRAQGKWNIMKGHLTKRIGSMLDFGGNVGNTAFILGRKIFRLPKDKVFVVDINEWEGEKWEPRNDITFVHFDKMGEIPSNSMDLITCFHTLHHIPQKDYFVILQEFNRILTRDGVIVLYEHNCADKEWAYLIDLEHAIYDVLVSRKLSYSKFIKNYYSQFLSMKKWDELFKKNNFTPYHSKDMNNKDNSFYVFFKKIH